MEEEQSYMKYYRIAIIVAIFLVIGVFAYTSYHYFNLGSFSSSSSGSDIIEENRNQLIYDGVPFVDDTIVEGNKAYAQVGGMYIETLYEIEDVDGEDINIPLLVNYTGNTRNISIYFAFDGALESGKVYLEREEPFYYNVTSTVNQWIENKLIDNVTTSTNLGTPDNRCELGNLNNTRMYEVTQNHNGTSKTQIYCFTDITTINQQTYRVSGNIDKEVKNQEIDYIKRDVDVTNKFSPKGDLLNDGKSFYEVNTIEFSDGDNYRLKFIITPKNKEKSGKFHVVMFDKDIGFINSVQNQNILLYLDPFWSSSWLSRRPIYLIDPVNVSRTGFYKHAQFYRIDGLNLNTNCSNELRIINDSEHEVPFDVLDGNTTYCNVYFAVDKNNTNNLTYYVYYNNPSATAPSYSSSLSISGSGTSSCSIVTGNMNYTALKKTYSTRYTLAWDDITDMYNNSQIYIGALNSTSPSIDPNCYVINDNNLFKVYQLNQSGLITNVTVFDGLYYTMASARGYSNDLSGFFNYQEALGGTSAGAKSVYAINDTANVEIFDGAPAITYPNRFVQSTTKATVNNIFLATKPTNWKKQGTAGYYRSSNQDDPIAYYVTSGWNSISGNISSWDKFYIGIANRTNETRINIEKQLNNDLILYIGEEETSANLVVSQSYPDDSFKTSLTSLDLACNFTGTGENISSVNVKVVNESFDEVFDNTESSLNTDSYNKTWSSVNLSDGIYEWACYGYGISGTNASTTNRTITIDSTAPIFALNYITNTSTLIMPSNLTFNMNITDDHSTDCWYNTSDSSTINYFLCATADIIVNFTTGGEKTIFVYANDSSFGNVNMTALEGAIYDFNVTQYENADPIAEGSTSIIYLLINSTSLPIGDAEAVITWNGTQYPASSKSVLDSNSIRFYYTFPVTAGLGNSTGVSYQYNWTYNATHLTTRTTSTATQTIISFGIDDCSVYGTEIANFSLRDEEGNNLLGNTTSRRIEIEALASSQINTDVTWSYSQTFVNESSIVLCVPDGSLNSTNFTLDLTLGYNADGYVQEFFFLDNGTIYLGMTEFNSYTENNVSLMDLLSADSTTFLFEFTDENSLEVEDAIVHVFRKYIGEGIYREVERARQDDNGQTHIHLVEEDVIYYFMITQNGEIIYTSDEYNAKCLSTPCQITLSASPDGTNWSLIENEGRKYSVTSDKTTRIVTTTFVLDSIDLVNVSLFEIDENGLRSLVNSSSLTATSGSIDLKVPLAYGNKSYFINIFNNNQIIKSQWVDFTESGRDYFGTTGLIFGGLIVVTIMLMAVSEGIGFIILTLLALIIISLMSLIDLSILSLISIICAGAIIIFKLVKRRQQA